MKYAKFVVNVNKHKYDTYYCLGTDQEFFSGYTYIKMLFDPNNTPIKRTPDIGYDTMHVVDKFLLDSFGKCLI